MRRWSVRHWAPRRGGQWPRGETSGSLAQRFQLLRDLDPADEPAAHESDNQPRVQGRVDVVDLKEPQGCEGGGAQDRGEQQVESSLAAGRG